MDVEYGLTGAFTGVEDETVLPRRVLVGERLSDRNNLGQEHGIARGKLGYGAVLVLGNDEGVHGRLRIDVTDGDDPFVLEQNVSGNLARDDPREDRR